MQKHRNYLKPGTTYKVTVAGGADSQALNAHCQIFRIAATADCYVSLSGTADNTDMLLLAEQAEYFACNPGSTVYVFGTADIHITEMM